MNEGGAGGADGGEVGVTPEARSTTGAADESMVEGEGRRIGRTVKVLGLVSLFTDAASEMIYPLLPVFLTSVLGAGAVFVGIVEGIAEGTASILKGFSGYISDRLMKRKALILAGYGLSAVTKPFFAAADAVWQVLVVRFVDRVGKGIRTAPRDAMIADTTGPSVRGRAYGFHRAMDTLGAVVGPAIAFLMMWLLRGQGDGAYRWVFLAAFVPSLIAVCLIVFALREKAPTGVAAGRFPRLTLSGFPRSFKMLLLVVVVFTLGNSSDAFLLLKAKAVFQEAGVRTTMIPVLIPLLWMTFNIVYSAVSMPGGMLSDRIGRKRTLLLGFVIYGLVYLGFGFAGRVVYVWLLMAAYGVFYGLTEGTLKAYVADHAPRDLKGTTFGVYYTTDGVSKLLASVSFGVIWQLGSPAAAFFVGAGLAAAAAVLLWLFCEECTA